ncbi:unnamed protein product, partial [Didymodactylos carnosus]
MCTPRGVPRESPSYSPG